MSSTRVESIDSSITLAEKLEQLASVFSDQQNLIEQGCGVLQNMSSQFEAVQDKYAPVRDQSVRLTTSLDNANRGYQAVKSILEDFQLHQKVEHLLVRNRGVESRLDELLRLLTELDRSTAFFLSRPQLSISETAIATNKQRTSEAYARCNSIFQRLLATYISVPVEEDLKAILKKELPDRPDAQTALVSNAKSLDDMHKLTHAMIKAEEFACVGEYVAARRKAVTSMMSSMGMQSPSQAPGAAAVAVSDPEKRVKEWCSSMKMLAQILEWEGQLAAALLPDSVQASALNDVLIGAVENTVVTGHSLSTGRLQPERLFLVLDMIVCMRASNVMPIMKVALNRPALLPLKENFNKLLSTLNAVAKRLSEAFLDTVSNDSAMLPKDISAATTVAPQTAFAMRFLKHLFKAEFVDHLLFLDKPQAFATTTTQSLLSSLQAKVMSGVKDPAAAAIAMMNNVNYMVTGVRDHQQLLAVLGDEWLQHQKLTLKRWRQDYFKHTWEALLGAIQDACAEAAPSMKKDNAKEYFKKINVRIEKVQSSQKLWSVPDASLRRQVREDILGSLVPGYTQFWTSYQGLDLFKNPHKYFKYAPDDLKALVNNDLFAGSKAGVRAVDASPVAKAFGGVNLNSRMG